MVALGVERYGLRLAGQFGRYGPVVGCSVVETRKCCKIFLAGVRLQVFVAFEYVGGAEYEE